MGVVVTHDVTDGLGRLLEWLVVSIAVTVHGVQNPPLHWLEPVSDVRQGPLLNDVLGVAAKAFAHDLLKRHFTNSFVSFWHKAKSPFLIVYLVQN